MKCETCGKEFVKENYKTNQAMLGAYNLHSYHCRVKELVSGTKKQNVSRETNIECNHAWRFLSKNIETEFQAIMQGYGEVCTKCKELQ